MRIEELYGGKKLTEEYKERFTRHYDELKWFYFELYQGQEKYFLQLCSSLLDYYRYRAEDLKESDRNRERAILIGTGRMIFLE